MISDMLKWRRVLAAQLQVLVGQLHGRRSGPGEQRRIGEQGLSAHHTVCFGDLQISVNVLEILDISIGNRWYGHGGLDGGD